MSAASEICRTPVINHRQEALSRADRLGQRGGGVLFGHSVCVDGPVAVVFPDLPLLLESGLVGTHPKAFKTD